MARDDLSYLANRTKAARRRPDPLFTFHYDSDGVEFGIGTLDEFDALKKLGMIDPDTHTRAVAA